VQLAAHRVAQIGAQVGVQMGFQMGVQMGVQICAQMGRGVDPTGGRATRTRLCVSSARPASVLGRVRGILIGLGLGALLGACGSAADERALAEFERLAFVPAGECTLVPREGLPVKCDTTTALLVDRFEVTRAEWLGFLAARRAPREEAFRILSASWSDENTGWPASAMTLDEAREYARTRDMRLLTAREWLRVACGTRAQPWPWGWSAARSVANTVELLLGHPVAVGTFELGQSQYSTYDMVGNVSEWVEEPIVRAGEGEESSLSWAMGGSCKTRLEPLYALDNAGRLTIAEIDLDPRARQDDVGMRCAAEAEPYLLAHAGQWVESRDARERLLAVGHRWGRDALALLEHLCASPSAPRGLRWLLEGARR
jgi:hypothetical protein